MPCVFCASTEKLSAEHVIPRWMYEFVADPEDRTGTFTRTTFRRDRGVEARSHSARPVSQTVKSVCVDCNNGWMSRLETQARPYLMTMLNGHGRTYHSGGRTLIATWLMKTALVAGSKFQPKLRGEFYSQFYAGRLPTAKTRVLLAATPERYSHTIDFRPIVVSAEEEPLADTPNAFSAVISVGQFAGFVVSWLDRQPAMTRVLPQFDGALVPIWPLEWNRTASWPPRLWLDLDGLDKLADTIVSTEEVERGRARPNL